jgi:hypothetical protein
LPRLAYTASRGSGKPFIERLLWQVVPVHTAASITRSLCNRRVSAAGDRDFN